MAEFIICFGSDDEKKENKEKRKQSSYIPENDRIRKKEKKSKKKFQKEDQLEKEKIQSIHIDTNNCIYEAKNLENKLITTSISSDSDIKISNTTCTAKFYPEELYYGNIEYKLKLVNTSKERKQNLITQMEFRLREGLGECYYNIGVEDNGNPLGLNPEDMKNSIETIQSLTEEIGATMTILNSIEGIKGTIVEVMITKKTMQEYKNKSEIRIGLIGEEGSGKSTLVGCLITDKKDNGKGLTRSNVFRHKHEIICGKTSSISHQIVGFDEKGKVTNHNTFGGSTSWSQIVDTSVKIINFFDLGGSEKTLKTTVKTLSKDYLDYVFLVIAANKGITQTSLDFLKIAISINVPIIAIFTKTDLINEEDITDVLYNFKYILKSQRKGINPLLVQNNDDIVSFSRNIGEGILPVFLISNKLGRGLNLFVNFLNLIPAISYPAEDIILVQNLDLLQFDILEIFTSDINTIIVGIVSKGLLIKGNSYLLGPDTSGSFKLVELISIHCKKIDVKSVSQGQFCSLLLDKSVTKENVRSGMVLLSQSCQPVATKVFEVNIWSMDGEDRKIKFTVQPIVHIAPVRQSIKIYGHLNQDDGQINLSNTEEEFEISASFPTRLFFEFMHYPEFVKEGSHLIIFENNFKIYGHLSRIIK